MDFSDVGGTHAGSATATRASSGDGRASAGRAVRTPSSHLTVARYAERTVPSLGQDGDDINQGRTMTTMRAMVGVAAVVAMAAGCTTAGPDPKIGISEARGDDTFDADVRALVGGDGYWNAVLPDPDGRVLGLVMVAGSTDHILFRLLADGSPDRSFGVDGSARIIGDIGAPNLAVNPVDRSVYVIGSAGQIARFSDAGQRDEAFGDDGWLETAMDFVFSGDSIVRFQSDGDFLILGRDRDRQNAIAAYHLDGTPVADFGRDGRVGPELELEPYIIDAEVDATDRLTILHAEAFALGLEFSITRLTPDGAVDRSFGADGVMTDSLGENLWIPLDLAIQSDGQLVLGTNGSPSAVEEGGDPKATFVAARYHANGFRDDTFGEGGLAETASDGDVAGGVPRMTVLDDDSIAVLRGSYKGPGLYARFGADGEAVDELVTPTAESWNKAVIDREGRLYRVWSDLTIERFDL
jgi:uncharacterized delta-60 repeat protein